MIDPKLIASFDQEATRLKEMAPPFFFGLYQSFVEQGFTEPQSFELVKLYVQGILGAGQLRIL